MVSDGGAETSVNNDNCAPRPNSAADNDFNSDEAARESLRTCALLGLSFWSNMKSAIKKLIKKSRFLTWS